MIWFLMVLVIFWKPVYYLGKYVYLSVKKIDGAGVYLGLIGDWFYELYRLVAINKEKM